jgi:hypothetical protein
VQATIFPIGTRKVRSAGRASGSIEITLPPELAALEGMDCRIVLRDGARPEIVLEPDLSLAAAIFTRAWSCLCTLLRLAGDIGEFPTQECELALLPGQRHNGRPLLVYSDAWQVNQGHHLDAAGSQAARAAALAGLIAPLATIAGHRLGLVSALATAFGSAVAGLAAPAGQRFAGNPEDFAADAARRIWDETCGPDARPLDVLAPQSQDNRAQRALLRIVSQFRAWQERPDSYALARAQWNESPDL